MTQYCEATVEQTGRSGEEREIARLAPLLRTFHRLGILAAVNSTVGAVGLTPLPVVTT